MLGCRALRTPYANGRVFGASAVRPRAYQPRDASVERAECRFERATAEEMWMPRGRRLHSVARVGMALRARTLRRETAEMCGRGGVSPSRLWSVRARVHIKGALHGAVLHRRLAPLALPCLVLSLSLVVPHPMR